MGAWKGVSWPAMLEMWMIDLGEERVLSCVGVVEEKVDEEEEEEAVARK